jgi:hypothetical protein
VQFDGRLEHETGTVPWVRLTIQGQAEGGEELVNSLIGRRGSREILATRLESWGRVAARSPNASRVTGGYTRRASTLKTTEFAVLRDRMACFSVLLGWLLDLVRQSFTPSNYFTKIRFEPGRRRFRLKLSGACRRCPVVRGKLLFE